MRKLLLILSLLPALHVSAAEVYVSAAASLTDALKAIAADYQKGSADRIVFNFGASGMLARQIEEGAPADLFISADEARMNVLQEKKLIDPATRVSILANVLVLVVPDQGGTSDLDKAGRIAIGDPATAPAGTYTRDYLRKVGLWERLQPKLVPLENVRAVLAAVESGNVDAGFVYRTDAMISKHVRIAREIKDAPPISYPFAITAHAQSAEAARRFLAYLQSEPAFAVFRRLGFIAH